MTQWVRRVGGVLLIAAFIVGLAVPAHAGPLDNWHWRSITPPGPAISYDAAIYHNDSYLVVGWNGTIMTSPDGITWTSRASGATQDLWDVAYGNGTLVAVGDSDLVTSPDGITWTARTSGATNVLSAVAYGANIFVTVGWGGTILSSPDGSSWTARTSGTTNSLYGLTYAAGKFVAVGDSGTILTSQDGINWSSQVSSVTERLQGVAYGEGTFLAVGEKGIVLWSSDGASWNSSYSVSFMIGMTFGATQTLLGVAYGGGSFVAAGTNGAIVTSPDGSNWTTHVTGTTSMLNSVNYCNGSFIIGGYQGVLQSDPLTPPAPSGLTATAVSADSIKLQWQDNSNNETDFRVEQKTGATWTEIHTGPQDWGQYTVTGLNPGTAYTFRVRAHNALGFSLYSNEGTATTQSGGGGLPTGSAPAAPSNLVATPGAGTSVRLTWQDNADSENEFIIERRTGTDPFAQIGTSPQDWGQYTDAAVVPGTTYDYRVAAYNVYGPSAYVEVSYTVPVDGGGGGGGGGTPPLTGASPWAVPEIQQAIAYGLTTDKVLSDFQQPITREEFCEIAVLLYQSLAGGLATPVSPNPFTDTVNPEILKAFGLGITKGVAPDLFAPYNHITRQEIAVMLWRALKAVDPALVAPVPPVGPFADEHLIASWAIEEIRFCNHHQIMKGVGGNAIDPLGNTTREQAIALVKRVYEAFCGGTP